MLGEGWSTKRLVRSGGANDGTRIDLEMRGAGDLIGTAQSGLPRFRVADLEGQSVLMAVAQSDARKLLHDDPELTSPRGLAARCLLWLMEQDQAIRLISVRSENLQFDNRYSAIRSPTSDNRRHAWLPRPKYLIDDTIPGNQSVGNRALW